VENPRRRAGDESGRVCQNYGTSWRKGFELDTQSPDLEGSSAGSDPGGHGLETRVLDALDSGVLSWEELVDALSSNFEDRLEETLESMQAENRVRYSGRKGGYTVVDQ